MSIRVFIADDHTVFRSGLRGLLEREEDLVVAGEAGTGGETLAALGKSGAQVLLLDLSLPDMPGARVAREARERLPDLGIVVLTMHEDANYLQALLKAGARGYVLKKSSFAGVAQAVRCAARGESYLDPALAGYVIAGFVGNPAGPVRPPDVLTAREREVCGLLALGHTSGEIAAKLGISERTAQTHRANIQEKLGLSSRAELVRFAAANGLVDFR